MGRVVDLNADVGESFGRWRLGDDDAVLDAVTSANVACGFHAGDPGTLRRTCERAAAGGVAIGAQVGYRDLAGFGRRFLDAGFADLRDDVLYQLGALEVFAAAAGSAVTYLKPHGALYHATVGHPDHAEAVVTAAAEFARGAGRTSFAVLGLPGSLLLECAARAGLRPVTEAFADRGYDADGRLVGRDHPGALLTDPDEVARRVVALVLDGTVRTVDGDVIPVAAESICLHGDTPGAAATAHAVRAALIAAGVVVRPFAG